MAHVPTPEQKRFQAAATHRDIDAICSSWPDAQEAAASRGYPTRSPGLRAAPSEVKTDPGDPLHARSMCPAKGGGHTGADLLDEVTRLEPAAPWISDVRRTVRVLLAISAIEARGDSHWTGPVDPSRLRSTLHRTVDDVVEWWVNGTPRLLEHIHALANIARREWPPTPEAGQAIETPEGTVVVGARTDTLAVTCAGCGQQVKGTAEDPVRHLSGDPYHATSCYYRAYRKARRAASKT